MARGAPDYATSRIPARTHYGFDDVTHDVQTMAGTGGIDHITSAAVPANKIWCLTNIVVYNISGISAYFFIAALTTAGVRTLAILAAPAQYQMLYVPGHVCIEEGELIRGTVVGAGVGDSLALAIYGTQIDVEL